MDTKKKNGMTLVEVVVAAAALSLIVLLGMSAFADLIRTSNSQVSMTKTDLVANQALREVASLLRPAILPVFITRTADELKNENDVYHDIDSRATGFGRSNGRLWLNALQAGTDAVAFVHPVDAQGVGDFLDAENHLQLGVVRNGRTYLSASASGTPRVGGDFVIRNGAAGEFVNALADVDPANMTSNHFETLDLTQFSFDWWGGSGLGAQPGVSCFITIRFAPMLDTSGVPVTLSEAELTAFNPNSPVDLNGDGANNTTFEVGSLQVVYSGSESSPFFWVDRNTNTIQTENNVPPFIYSLTPNIVLRESVVGNRTPIFRLVDYTDDNLERGGTNPGMVNERSGGGTKAMFVRVLLLDTEAIAIAQDGQKVLSRGTRNFSARWYETTIGLKNMER